MNWDIGSLRQRWWDSELRECIRIFSMAKSQCFSLVRTNLLALRRIMKLYYACRVIIADIVIKRHVEHMASLSISIVVIKMLLELCAPLGGQGAPISSPIQFLAHVSEFQKSILFTSYRIKDLYCVKNSEKDCTVWMAFFSWLLCSIRSEDQRIKWILPCRIWIDLFPDVISRYFVVIKKNRWSWSERTDDIKCMNRSQLFISLKQFRKCFF